MKKAIFLIGGICGAAAGMIVVLSRQPKPVDVLAHQLEEAWADHHTIA
jgi:hypothetical protein